MLVLQRGGPSGARSGAAGVCNELLVCKSPRSSLGAVRVPRGSCGFALAPRGRSTVPAGCVPTSVLGGDSPRAADQLKFEYFQTVPAGLVGIFQPLLCAPLIQSSSTVETFGRAPTAPSALALSPPGAGPVPARRRSGNAVDPSRTLPSSPGPGEQPPQRRREPLRAAPARQPVVPVPGTTLTLHPPRTVTGSLSTRRAANSPNPSSGREI